MEAKQTKQISFIGILLGFLIKNGIDLVFCSMLMIFITEHLLHPNPSEDMSSIKNKLLLIALGLDCLTIVLGGYIASRIAKKSTYLNSGLTGLSLLIMGLFFIKVYPLWFNITRCTLVVPCSLIGGYLASSKIKAE